VSVSTSAPASAHNRGRPLSSISFRDVEVSLHNTFGYSFAGLEPMGLSPPLAFSLVRDSAPTTLCLAGVARQFLGFGPASPSFFWPVSGRCVAVLLLLRVAAPRTYYR
jgi:hypothetical protein